MNTYDKIIDILLEARLNEGFFSRLAAAKKRREFHDPDRKARHAGRAHDKKYGQERNDANRAAEKANRVIRKSGGYHHGHDVMDAHGGKGATTRHTTGGWTPDRPYHGDPEKWGDSKPSSSYKDWDQGSDQKASFDRWQKQSSDSADKTDALNKSRGEHGSAASNLRANRLKAQAALKSKSSPLKRVISKGVSGIGKLLGMKRKGKGLGRWGAQKAARPREEEFPESTSYVYDRLVDMLVESIMPTKPKRTGGIIMNPKKQIPKKKTDYRTPSTIPSKKGKKPL